MYNFDPFNVLLAIATNIPVLLMTALVLQGQILQYIFQSVVHLHFFIFIFILHSIYLIITFYII